MKKIFNLLLVLILLILSIITCLYIKLISDYKELCIQIKTQEFQNNEQLEKLNKEIRLLKMDVYINTYGFEGESND